MTYGFRRTRDGGVKVRLAEQETALIRSLVGQVAALIDSELGPAEPVSADDAAEPLTVELRLSDRTSAPEDPVLARLFPDAYANDPEAAGEFRRYTETALRDGKRAAALVVLATATPGEIRLDTEQAQAWLTALNDVRLALGTRLEVTEEIHEELNRMSPEDARYSALAVYDWLTFLQESLVRALW